MAWPLRGITADGWAISGLMRQILFSSMSLFTFILAFLSSLTTGMKLALSISVRFAMKPLNNYSSPDQNWQWPEKTWFRERLNAIKAREHEQRRKPVVGNQTTQGASEPANPEKGPLKAD